MAGADILIVSHFHHHGRLRQDNRDLVLCPSMDGGSRWLTNSSGIESRPGTMFLVIDEDGIAQTKVL